MQKWSQHSVNMNHLVSYFLVFANFNVISGEKIGNKILPMCRGIGQKHTMHCCRILINFSYCQGMPIKRIKKKLREPILQDGLVGKHEPFSEID